MRDRQEKVEDNSTYTKNPVRGTIVNVNTNAYSARKAKLRIEQEQNERLNKLEEGMNDIKLLLKELINRE